MHAYLYAKKHKTFNECIYDAIVLDDNCDIYAKDKPISKVDSLSSTSRNTQEPNKDKSYKVEAMVGNDHEKDESSIQTTTTHAF